MSYGLVSYGAMGQGGRGKAGYGSVRWVKAVKAGLGMER